MKTLSLDLESPAGRRRAQLAVTRMFAKQGVTVIATAVDEKATKRAGAEFRRMHLTFADNQQVSFAVKASGDVFEVRLNDKAVPVREQDDHVKAIAEIADWLDKTRTAFQRQLARIKVPVPPAVRTSRINQVKALEARNGELRAAIAAGREELAALAPAA